MECLKPETWTLSTLRQRTNDHMAHCLLQTEADAPENIEEVLPVL